MTKQSAEEKLVRYVNENFFPLLAIAVMALVVATMFATSGDITGQVTRWTESEENESACRYYDFASDECFEYMNGTVIVPRSERVPVLI